MSLLTIAACLAMPAALAESECVDAVCANYEDESWGDGTCAGSADHYAYRGYSVTYTDGSSVTGAYVFQYCWTYDDGESSGDGTAMSIAVTRLEGFAYDGAVVYWESGEWNGESWCGTMLHTHTPVGVNVFEPLGCPAGDAPPMLLPEKPALP